MGKRSVLVSRSPNVERDMFYTSFESFWCIESKCSPFVAFKADHDDEQDGYDAPAQDDVHHEEAASINHVVLHDIVRSSIGGKVITRADRASVTETHHMHCDEDQVGQYASQFLSRARERLQCR